MSKIRVSLKIDVSKIDKARLYKGQKGTYLDAMAIIDLDAQDQYENNGMIVQSVSKDERTAGVKGNILGNNRIIWREEDSQEQPPEAQANHQPPPHAGIDDDDIPF